MSFVKARKLKHEFARRDEQGEIKEVIEAVKDVDLDIKEGEFVAILGHNGSGKSTLAKHLNVLLTPTGGTLWVDGMDAGDENNTLDIRKAAGMVFQNPDNQMVAGVVEEDVAFGPENIGIPTEEIWERVAASLEAVGMTAYRYQPPGRLSGGQKQRIAIAGIVAMEPKCIILDESTAMLDPHGRREVLQTVLELNRKKGVTVILITHYMEEVVFADHMYVMNDGEIALTGAPREVFGQIEKIKSLGLSVPQITQLAYELHQAGVPVPADVLTREELVEAICQWKYKM
ncbi:Energy-coupling factor transporter ATP-binding protein EcfA1 [uncultured Roseburia sp.]|uniref:Energy-coupling factor transporter ATPase n=1 Tax=Brotonthovivens ammoniilytica TaxID=2981725 RepID=A0ABT2TLD8_9FIRM|nr:energy-coupling factor transporter ATPase [Brotonthovivens ammoniilytica]MCU6762897.1 energy-coupling factor transporter ATPase [Brotonthovivens ammoniilytica]SCI92996.1 Energy-coupling factor transporter ATP-binding protein EcfA1 [uncultured Roseburia sp.]